MKKTYLLLVFFLTVFCASVVAQKKYQEGYVVTCLGDTIRGQIYYTSKKQMYKYCRFKKGDEITRYEPADLIAYAIKDNNAFESGIEQEFFVELLVKGKLSLYKKGNYYYMKKNGKIHKLEEYRKEVQQGCSVQVENKRWLGVVHYLVRDELDRKIDPRKFHFSEKFFTELVSKYNAQGGNEYSVKKKNLPWRKNHYGIVGGVKYETLNINNKGGGYLFLDNQYSIVAPYVGIILNTYSPRISDKLSFQVEALFSKVKISSTKIEESNAYTDYFDNYFDLTKLSLPVSLNYDFPTKKKLQLHMQFGTVLDYNINSEYRRLSERIFYSTVSKNESKDLEINKVQLGIMGGVYVSKDFKNFKGSMGMRYSKINSLVQDKFVDITQDRISFSIIISTK